MTKVRDIQANPFRHLDRYPIRREKVEALKASIQTTGFWDNIVARPHEDGPQIAYGHHRLVAMQEALGEDAEVSLILRDLDDPQMLKIMASENMTEWESSAEIDQETIRAVIEAFSAGQLTDADFRSEPGSEPKNRNAQKGPLSAPEVAIFLGWDVEKVYRAMRVLDAIEEGIVDEADTTGLRPSGAEKLVRATKQITEAAVRRGVPEPKAKKMAKAIAHSVAEDLKAEQIASGGGAITHEVHRRLDEKVPAPFPAIQAIPSDVARDLLHDIQGFWPGFVSHSFRSSRLQAAQVIAANRNAISLKGLGDSLPKEIAVALRDMATTATTIADQIESDTTMEASA